MRKRTVLLTLGGLFLLAALALTARNLRQEARAQTAAEQTLQTLAPIVQTAADAQTPLEAEAVPADEQVIPDYQLDPQMEMPVTTIDGVDYIGVLEIPALKLTLPVAGDWSYALLDLAPCRYAGSAYLDDLVILGHNYRGFFRDLSQLQPGDTVFFTDTDGNRFSYAVSGYNGVLKKPLRRKCERTTEERRHEYAVGEKLVRCIGISHHLLEIELCLCEHRL